MQFNVLFMIRNNPNLYNYLKYNSYWYKELIRNPNIVKYMSEEMKKEYKLTPSDKLKKVSDNINMIKAFMEIV